MFKSETIAMQKLQCGEFLLYNIAGKSLFSGFERQRLRELKSNAMCGIIYFIYSANLTFPVESYHIVTAVFAEKRDIKAG